MSHTIAEKRYCKHRLSISEYVVEIDDDRVEIREYIGDDVESDAVVLVQAIEREFGQLQTYMSLDTHL